MISEGQGFGKSKMVGWLFPEDEDGTLRRMCGGAGLKLNLLGTMGERDMLAGLLGRVIVEIGDLAGIRKADMQTLNAWIAETHDTLSLKWRGPQLFPRRWALIGTSDRPTAALPADPAGMRRWLPVHLASPHGSLTRQQSGWHVLAVLDAEREQLWAEALSWQQTGRPPIPNGMWDAADAQAAAHRDANPLAEVISEALDRKCRYGSLQEIWGELQTHAVGPNGKTMLAPNVKSQLSDALMEQGWRRKTVRRSDGTFPKLYVADVDNVDTDHADRT